MSFAILSNSFCKQPNTSNLWVGVAYLYATQVDDSPEVSAVFGVVGSVESTLFGAAAAGAWGGPVGAGVGLAVGL